MSLEVGPATEPPGRPRDLAALLAKALVHRTLAYEATNPLALSYAANPVRPWVPGRSPSATYRGSPGSARRRWP